MFSKCSSVTVLSKRQFGRSPLKSGNGDGVIERIVQPAQVNGLRRDDQVGSDQPQVMTRARAEHHAMFAEADGLPVTVDGGVVNRENRHQSAVGAGNLIGPNPETLQHVGPERRGDRDIGRIAASRHQNPAHPRHIVARVENVPAAADPGLKPPREIAWGERRWRSNIAQVAGAISRRNIQATAEGDGKMCVVAANAGPFVESLRGAAGRAGVLVVEGDMVMNIIADGLHARVPWSRAAEELPSRLGQQIGLAIAAAQQEHEGFFGQILHGVLPGGGHNLIWLAAISDYSVGRKAEASCRREQAVAEISEGVAIVADLE